MKTTKLLTFSCILIFTGLHVQADTGIGDTSHVELNFINNTNNYSVRCYGQPVRHGDIGDLFKDMDWVKIGYNDSDRGRLISDQSNNIEDSVIMTVDYPDYSNTYNVSWAVCYVYPSVHLQCADYKSVDITDKTSGNAYSKTESEYGGPDPMVFGIHAKEYDDYKTKMRYDSPVAVIEIGITPRSGAFYNLIPLYNPGSTYNYTDGYTDMTYKYTNMGRDYTCESMGLISPIHTTEPINANANENYLRLEYNVTNSLELSLKGKR